MSAPFCERHKRRKTAICRCLKCPEVFVCEGRECVVEHMHSRELLSTFFVERIIRQAADLERFIIEEVQNKIEGYYERACEEINTSINQYKEMTLLLLDKYRGQISLSPEDASLVERLRGESIYSCSKEDILRGWSLLSLASTEVTKDKEIGFIINDINFAIDNFQANLAKLQKTGLSKLFDFQGSVFKDLRELDIKKDQYDVLEELLSKKNVTLKRARVAFNAREHNYSAYKYHELCNGLQNTLTIVRSDNKKLFGGFIGAKINSSGNYSSDSKAFLFSVDNNTLCVQNTNQTYALYFMSNYGPTWGGNHDLYLADNCGNNSDSYSQLNHTYRALESGVQQQYTLAGQRNFKVLNYMVFELDPSTTDGIKKDSGENQVAADQDPQAGQEEQ